MLPPMPCPKITNGKSSIFDPFPFLLTLFSHHKKCVFSAKRQGCMTLKLVYQLCLVHWSQAKTTPFPTWSDDDTTMAEEPSWEAPNICSTPNTHVAVGHATNHIPQNFAKRTCWSRVFSGEPTPSYGKWLG